MGNDILSTDLGPFIRGSFNDAVNISDYT